MSNPTEISKQKALGKEEEENENVHAGKKAIEADKAINKKDKPEKQKNEEEQKDAAQWRNEG